MLKKNYCLLFRKKKKVNNLCCCGILYLQNSKKSADIMGGGLATRDVNKLTTLLNYKLFVKYSEFKQILFLKCYHTILTSISCE